MSIWTKSPGTIYGTWSCPKSMYFDPFWAPFWHLRSPPQISFPSILMDSGHSGNTPPKRWSKKWPKKCHFWCVRTPQNHQFWGHFWPLFDTSGVVLAPPNILHYHTGVLLAPPTTSGNTTKKGVKNHLKTVKITLFWVILDYPESYRSILIYLYVQEALLLTHQGRWTPVYTKIHQNSVILGYLGVSTTKTHRRKMMHFPPSLALNTHSAPVKHGTPTCNDPLLHGIACNDMMSINTSVILVHV